MDSAGMGFCFYQKFPFLASDHVEKLIPKFPMNNFLALFISNIIYVEQYRYNYDRKCSQSRMKGATILLPSTELGEIDFKLMEEYMNDYHTLQVSHLRLANFKSQLVCQVICVILFDRQA